MRTTRLRHALVVVTAGAILASLAVTAAAAPATAAKPKCMGKTATIVGTKKADVIRGTRKADVIVTKGGADKIYGRGGNDIICAGKGNDRVVGQGGIDRLVGGAGADTLFGGTGPDRLFGGPGPDVLAGQAANDTLDGGFGVDTCYQGLGSGSVVRCEKPAPPTAPTPAPTPTPTPAPPLEADLAVVVDGPTHVSSGIQLKYTVSVRNNGPAATSYELHPTLSYEDYKYGGCSPVSEPSGGQPSIASGTSIDFTYAYNCAGSDLYARLTVEVTPASRVIDPVPDNNSHSDVTSVL